MSEKRLVTYHNDLNEISMKSWNSEEMDFFFSIIYKIKNLGTKEVSFDTDEIKELADFNDKTSRWVNILKGVAEKVINIKYIEQTEDKIHYFMLFQEFTIDISKKQVSLKVSDRFDYIVNKIQANFTVFELSEFTRLKSTYSKTMYRNLKQWKSIGKKEYTIEQFRSILEIPDSYDSGKINSRVINQIRKELPAYFEDLKIKTIKSNKKGTPITGFCFTWEPQISSKPKFIADKYKKEAEEKKRKESLKNRDIDKNSPEMNALIERLNKKGDKNQD